MSTEELYAQIAYQPLTLGSGIGRLHFGKAADLETEYLSPRDIVVLDETPNDISVVTGLKRTAQPIVLSRRQHGRARDRSLSMQRHQKGFMALEKALGEVSLRAIWWTSGVFFRGVVIGLWVRLPQ